MSQKKILLVEDNELNRQIFSVFIEINNYVPLIAPTAEAAFSILEDTKPDLILMDIMLPGMDGIEAVRKLKADPDLKNIPVLAISAYSTSKEKKAAMEAGCLEYILKPVILEEFSIIIDKYLSIN